MEMIGWPQILTAAVVTALGVGMTAMAVRWPLSTTLSASIAAFLLIVAWRGGSNLLGLNGDFLPAVSLGDVGSLPVGAVGPALTARLVQVPRDRLWLPALAGAVVGFFANVVIL
jgi:hypothetical protein